MKIDPGSTANFMIAHHLLTDVVVPRPIAWVSTEDEHGVFNLAPFSCYGLICAKPAVVGIGIGTNRYGQKKDTCRNIEFSKEFVINIVDENLAEAMNQTSAPYPREVSEFKEVKLTSVKADLVKAPMVLESPINMECRVLQVIEFGEFPSIQNFFIGEVLRVHIKDELWDGKNVDMAKLKPIGRLGGEGDRYTRTRDVFLMERPEIA